MHGCVRQGARLRIVLFLVTLQANLLLPKLIDHPREDCGLLRDVH